MSLPGNLMGQFGGKFGSMGLLSRTRGTLTRVRSTIRPPRLGAEAARVVVKNASGVALVQTYVAGVLTTVTKEVWAYSKDGDMQAVLTLYLDSATSKYKYVVSKVTADSLSVEFDAAPVGTLAAIGQINTPGAGQIILEASPLTA